MTNITMDQESEISKNLDNLFGDDEPIFEFNDKGSPVVTGNTADNANDKSKKTDSDADNVYNTNIHEVVNSANVIEATAANIIELKEEEKKSPEGTDTKNVKSTSLEALQAIMLSNEWEISFSNFQKIIDEIKKLKKSYNDDKQITKLLLIIESISKYLLKNKTDSSHEAFRIIEFAYKNFEKVISEPEKNKQKKDKIISETIKKFKEFKKKITPKKIEKAHDELIKAAIKRIEIYVKKEIALLRNQLKHEHPSLNKD